MSQIIGTLQEIQETKIYPKKDGSGDVSITKLKIDNKYFTSFSKEEVNALHVNMRVEGYYTSKENVFEGKRYINNNLTSIIPFVGDQEQLPQDKVEAVKEVLQNPEATAEDVEKIFEKGSAVIELGGKKFKVTLEDVK